MNLTYLIIRKVKKYKWISELLKMKEKNRNKPKKKYKKIK